MKMTFKVENKDDGKRIVDVLKDTYGMSSMLTKRIRLYGSLKVNTVDRRMIDPAYNGDIIDVAYDERPEEPFEVPDREGVHIVYSDRNIIVASKPSGMVTHPVSYHQSGTLTDIYKDFRIHPVSRLDKDTTGLILLARDPYSHYALASGHNSGGFYKEYRAICHGSFDPPLGIIDSPIGRRSDTKMLRRVTASGAGACTEYETIDSYHGGEISYLKFILHTGKTHQIRVHCLYSGHPIVGDPLYGPNSNENAHYCSSMDHDSKINRQALHAYRLSFRHPITGKAIDITCDLPYDMLLLTNP